MNRLVRQRKGVALVEFALVVMLLFTLFLGIIEFGVIIFRQFTLTQVAREGSRHASLGRSVEQIEERIQNTAGALNANDIVISLTYSTDDGQTYPNTLGNNGPDNDALPGNLIKVHLDYPHHLVTGAFFAPLFSAQNNTITLNTDVIMRRE